MLKKIAKLKIVFFTLVSLILVSLPAKADCWYNTNWSHRIKVRIAQAQVNGSHTDFPVYFDLNDLAATNFFGQVRADGGDIRITQSDGKTELAREIVAINTGASTGEMHFEVPFLSGGEEFYIYYGNAAATDHAITDPFGAENVWAAGFTAVYHMETLTAATPSVIDSTSSGFDGTPINMTTGANVGTGKFSNAIIFNEDAVTFDRVSLPIGVMNGLSDFTVSVWFRSVVTSATQAIFSNARAGQANEFLIWTPNTTNIQIFDKGPADNFPAGFNYFDLAWHKIDVVRDDTNNRNSVYLDGVFLATVSRTKTPIITAVGGLILGEEQDSVGGGFATTQGLDGLIDILTVNTNLRSGDWITTEFNNQDNPSGFWTVSAEDTQGTQWYGCDWKHRKVIRVVPAQVTGTQTDYPAYFDLSNLSASNFFADVRSDGGDIRITQCDGTTELAREIVSIDTAADTGELHFKIPSMSGAEEFFIYYGNPTATEPASAAAFGSENVWTHNYLVVYHMQEDPSTGNLIDSSPNSNDGTPQNMGGEATVTGQLGQAYDFDGADEYISTAIDGSEFDEITVSTWFNNDLANTPNNYIYDNSPGTTGYSSRLEGGATKSLIAFAYANTGADIATHGATLVGTWYSMNQTIDGTNVNIYVDGSLSDAEPQNATGIRDTSDTFEIARHSDNDAAGEFDGSIDELRIATEARDLNWISSEYNNQNSPSTFWDLTVLDDTLEIISFTPLDNGTAASVTANLEVLFDQAPILLNGDVILRRLSDDSVFDTYDSNGSVMTVTGNNVSFRLPNPLFYNEYYYVELGCGAFGPVLGAPFAGFDDNGTWNFYSGGMDPEIDFFGKSFH